MLADLLAQVQEYEALLENATPGPWNAGPTPGYLGAQQWKDGGPRRSDPLTIRSPAHTEEIATVWTYLLPTEANAALIAAAPDALRVLCQAVRGLLQQNEEIKTVAIEAQGECDKTIAALRFGLEQTSLQNDELRVELSRLTTALKHIERLQGRHRGTGSHCSCFDKERGGILLSALPWEGVTPDHIVVDEVSREPSPAPNQKGQAP